MGQTDQENQEQTGLSIPDVARVTADVRAFNAAVMALVDAGDIHVTRDRDGKQRAFYKKSFFRKLAKHFGIKVERVEESHEMIDGDMVYFATYLATGPDGRTATGDGTCSFKELEGKRQNQTHHMGRSVANTRAFNRAVSNLEARGMVSAEEANIGAAVATETGKGSEAPREATPANGGASITEKQWGWLKGTVDSKNVKDSELVALLDELAPGLPKMEGKDLPDTKKLTRDQWKAVMGRLGVKIA